MVSSQEGDVDDVDGDAVVDNGAAGSDSQLA